MVCCDGMQRMVCCMVCRGWYVVWYVEDGMVCCMVCQRYVVWYVEDGMLYGM